jgi:hypothetical protein
MVSVVLSKETKEEGESRRDTKGGRPEAYEVPKIGSGSFDQTPLMIYDARLGANGLTFARETVQQRPTRPVPPLA